MSMQIYSHPGLRVILEKLKCTYPQLSHTEYLPPKPSRAKDFLLKLPAPQGGIVLDGTDIIPLGIQNLHVPNVHNAAALLLGSNQCYQRLLSAYNAGVAFSFPGLDEIYYFSAPKDCHILCKIVDLDWNIAETPGASRLEAALHEMDYIELPSDLRLLRNFLHKHLHD